MYVLCKAMDWKHLPWAGGIYDQHPDFIDKMMETMRLEAQVEAQEQKARDRNKGLSKPSRSSRRR